MNNVQKVAGVLGALIGSWINYIIVEWLFGNVVATIYAVYSFVISLFIINKLDKSMKQSAHKRHNRKDYGTVIDVEVA